MCKCCSRCFRQTEPGSRPSDMFQWSSTHKAPDRLQPQTQHRWFAEEKTNKQKNNHNDDVTDFLILIANCN